MSKRQSRDEGDRFRVRPGAPKQRGQTFIAQVLRHAGSGRKAGKPPGSRLGRGHVAARFTGRALSPNYRRVTIKTRMVNLRHVGARSTLTHLRYIEREGVGRQGEPGRAYGPATDDADPGTFEERGREDRHQFRFIVSPEDAAQLDDLRTYTRHLMGRMEADLGTRLEWIAADHWNTDNPHTHIVLRGKDDTGNDLIISPDYLTRGMRERAAGLATAWLGPRTEQEIRQSLQREVEQERWTSLDRTLQRHAQAGVIHLHQPAADARARQQRVLLIGRLQYLQRMGLASEDSSGIWVIRPDAEPALRAMGERGDILRTMQRAMRGLSRDLAMFEPAQNTSSVVGRVVAKGLADELYDQSYLVVDGLDGKAHYVVLPARTELEQFPIGGVVEARGLGKARAADQNIAALAIDGVYRTDHHLAVAQAQAAPGRDPVEVVQAHVRRLEALRRAGIVTRVTEGVWRVPTDLPEKGNQFDRRQGGDISITLRSHLSIAQQTRVIGATWLDHVLVGDSRTIGERGFGAEVHEALGQRTEFLIEQGLATRHEQRTVPMRNLLRTLRERDVATAAERIAQETGLTYRATVDGERIRGVYRRNFLLTSGRFAMLDDGVGFSLVPWRPVIEQRLGQTVTAVIRGSGISWTFGRERGPSIG